MSPGRQSHEENESAGPPDANEVEMTETPNVDGEQAGALVELEETPEPLEGRLTLEDRIHNLEVKVEALETRVGTHRPMTPEEASDAAKLSAEQQRHKQRVAAERELRRYIKRDGKGLVKGLSVIQKARAKELLQMLGRKKLTFDLSLIP